MKSFLGLINFLARFTPNLATEAEHLRRLTRSGNKWIWGPDQQKSFHGLKNGISRASCLAFFDKDRKTELRVDASPVRLGAILCQIQGDGTSRPVAYASRSLSDVERRYNQIEREALAVKFGCLKFDHYLSGDPDFTIITDHKPLLGLYKPGSRPPPRIERWALRIQHLNFRLRYEPGPKNAADVFSRQPTPPRAHVNPSEHADTRMINAITAASLPRACTIEQVKEATAKDATLQTVLKSLQSGTWNKDLGLFFSHRNEFSFSDWVLLRNNRIVIPRSLVQDQPTTQVDLFLQNHNKKIFILLFYTYTVISKISNLMQKCVTIYSNIRTTHKYGNILQMKIEKYNILYAHICKNLSVQTSIILQQKFIKRFV